MEISFNLRDMVADDAKKGILKRVEAIENSFGYTCISINSKVVKKGFYLDIEDYTPEGIKEGISDINDKADYFVIAHFDEYKENI